jgi:proline iminopeptidase
MRGQLINLPSRDVALYVKQAGNGYPLLLMHGGLGVDHSTLLPIAKCRDAFRLIFYDHRCNGRSTGAEISSMTWDNLTQDAEALRKVLGIDKWAVLGHSFGGMIALEYALRYPKSVTHLVLMDTGAEAKLLQVNAPAVLAKRGFSPGKIETARRLFNGELGADKIATAMVRLGKAYYHRFGPLVQIRAVVDALKIKSNPEACVFGFQNLLKDWSITERLSGISVPALLIAGADDFQFPPEHQMEMAKALPNARCLIIEKAAHNPLVEQPKQTIESIRAFVRS